MLARTTQKGRNWAVAGLALLAGARLLSGQVAGGGSIQGTITDQSGAVVPQASVTAVNAATGVESVRLTTAAGLYVISPLPPGEYRVRVAASGFGTLTQEHVIVEALATVGLDLQLKVGAAAEQVTVEAAAPMLHTEDATLGGSMQNNVYEALPLAMNGVPRDPTQFIGLISGVSNLATQVAGPSTASFNGAPVGANEIYVEGLPLTFPSQQADTRNLAFGISVEAVDQFQAETNGQKAMYQGSGFENFVLKSGTDRFHGGVYEYFRNTDLDARGFFPATTPVEHQNEFGGTIGGPIKKGKLFFFGGYSGYYYKTAQAPQFQSIPTLAERQGDFSAFPAVVYDPKTQVCNGAICTKQPFPNNVIDPSRISPISKSLQSYLVNPINTGIQNNYLASLPQGLHDNNTTEKVDWNASNKDRLYAVFSRGRYSTDFTGSLAAGTNSTPLPYTQGRIVQENPTTVQLHYTRTITPNLLNDISAGYGRIWIPLISATEGGQFPTKAGIKGLPAGGASDVFPTINFGGTNAPIGWAGTNAVAFDQAENAYTLQDNLQWVHGKHAMTFGFQLQRGQDNNTNPDTGTRATFTFSNNETAGFSPTGTLLATSGNSYASYLLGALNSASVTDNYIVELGSRFHSYAGWIQDDWKISSRLTLNIGLRDDLLGPYHEAYDRTSYLNPNARNPAAAGRLGALQFSGSGPGRCNCGNIPIKTHYFNLEPRIGLAFRITEKTVLRAGYGINYFHGAGTGNNGTGVSPGQLGFNANASFSSAVTGQPAFYWDNGVPAYQKPPFIDPGYGVGFTVANPTGAVTPSYVNPATGAKPPYSISFNAGIQREIAANTTLGIAYAGNTGHYLSNGGGTGIWSDSMPLPYLALGSLLGAQATAANIASANAIIPGIGLPFSTFSGTIGQMLKPYPQYTGITYLWSNRGNSSYHSLQVSLDRRMTKSLTFHMGYVFSKELDNITTSRNPFDGSLDRAPGAIDHPHIFTGTVVYHLPFGKGHTMGNRNALVTGLVSGWMVAGVATFSSGSPLAISGNGCVVTGIVSTCIPSYNPAFNGPARINGGYGDGNVLGTGALAYLDKNAFVNPVPYTFGNLARAAPFGLLSPYTLNEDVSVRREIAIHERVKLGIEANIFNITNSVVFAAPATNIDSSNFGQLTSQRNLPRKVQFNARLSF
jgi:hypothetical protein